MGLSERRFLNRAGPGFASNDGAIPTEPDLSEQGRCHFEVFRADQVAMTSTQFGGGDWRWRLSEHDGKCLVEAGGYPSEARCREAVSILQARAAFAKLA